MSRLPYSILITVLTWLMAAPVGAATLSLCSSLVAGGDARLLAEPFIGATRLQLLLGDSAIDDDCESLVLPVPSDQVRWAALATNPMPRMPVNRLGLQGSFTDNSTVISEVVWGMPGAESVPFLPFNDDLLPLFTSTAFGIEDRARVDPDSNTLYCEAGTNPAGILLQTRSAWQRVDNLVLTLMGAGIGTFEIGLSDAQRQNAGTPLAVGTVVLSERDRARFFDFRVPLNNASWSAVTIVCPPQAAEINLTGLFLNPEKSEIVPPRSAWFWAPEVWLETPDLIWETAAREGLKEIYLTIPTSTAGVLLNGDALAQFIALCSRRGIRVWATIGDPYDVLPGNLETLLTRLKAYRDYNVAQPAASSLHGVQLDIEPYLIPGFGLDQPYWRARYLETVTRAHGALEQALPLDLVMPVWWGSHPEWGSRLLAELALPDLSLTVMNYRTNLAQLRAGAIPFLNWGKSAGVSIRMALEFGPLPNETYRNYAPTELRGELWLTRLGSHDLLMLLEAPSVGVPGLPFTQLSESTVRAETLTFAGDPERLRETVTLLESEWSAWTSFAGVAIHGLEEVYNYQEGL